VGKAFVTIFFVCSVLFLPTLTFGQSQLKSKSNTKTEREKVFLSAMMVLPENERPAGLHLESLNLQTSGCATILVEQARQLFDTFTPEQQSQLKKLLSRPQLPFSFISAGGRFKIHYTISGADAVSSTDSNNNGIPDFVESVAEGFERSFDVEINELSYRQQPADNGADGDEYDVYIENLGTQFYGFTQGEDAINATPNDDLTSYIVIDNDFNNRHFTRGLNGALVTTAHEFFHAIQFGYRTLKNSEEAFYYELCSVWMEDVVFDDINDYFQYLPSFLSQRDIPFNKFSNSNFGEALWYHFLVKKLQSPDIVRRTWELMAEDDLAIFAIDLALQEQGRSLSSEFANFAIWNYFTGSRADVVNYYEEGNLYPEIAIRDTFLVTAKVSASDSSKGLTHHYFKFRIPTAGEYAVSGNVEQPSNWLFTSMVLENDQPVQTAVFQPVTGKNFGFLPAGSEVIVVAINTKVVDGNELSKLNTDFLNFTIDVFPGSVKVPDREGIVAAYPNPFVLKKTNQITFVLNLTAAQNEMAFKVFSADGRVVREFTSSTPVTVFSWNGRNDSGGKVSSGIYLLQMTDGTKRFYKKFALIRE